MEQGLRALRQLSAGLSNEAAVLKAASLVPVEPDEPQERCGKNMRQLSDSESDEELQDAGEAQKLSELYTWGRATNYQLGYGVSGNEQQIPKLVQLPTGAQVMSLSCGRFHSTAVTACGRVFTWGFAGASGRLGIESFREAVVVPTPLPEFGPGRHHAVKVATGIQHTLAMTAAGKILVWGSNERGQLGMPGESCLKPAVLKAASLQKHRVSDIAAGAMHSLCIAGECGSVFAWGCNLQGALGLGAAPTGPSSTNQPQSLPHLKSATLITANPCGHVSLCLLMSHGDAMMFGSSSPGDKTDQRFFLPSRVRRREPNPTVSDVDWQLQRGSHLSPLRWATLSDSEGFGIDTDGLLWVWPTSSRPVSAELVSVSLRREVRSRLASVEDPGFILVEDGEEIEVLVQEEASREVLASVNEVQEVGISDLGVSFKAGITWAIDDSDAGHLWQLKRAKSKGSWLAERFEYLAQVSCFACGPEHQAAVTSYTVPTSHSEEKGLAVSELGDASGAVVRDGAVCAVRSVPSLQQVCEEKLCAKLNPRSFGLVCDIAWELNRPALLDRAFGFLCANAPLMFSKLHLPTLSQLPIEVLAAFEMAAKAKQKLKVAKVTVPSETPIEKEVRRESLQEACPQDFGFDIDLEDPILRELIHLCENGQWSVVSSAALSLLATSMLGTAAGEGLVAEKLGLSFALSEIERVELEAETEKEEAQARPRRRASQTSPQVASKASPAMSSKSSPKSSAMSPPLQHQKSPALEAQGFDWVEVKNAKRKSSDSKPMTPKVKAESPTVPPSQPSPKGVRPVGREVKGQGKTSLMSLDDGPSRHLRLTDFMPRSGKGKEGKREAKTPEAGPSAILVSAVESAGKDGAWALPNVEQSPLSDILEAHSKEKSKTSKAKTGSKPTPKVMTCSWGRDALPSEQTKNQSISEIQQEEELLREHDEILEIEAMFAALEVAEIEEALEQSRVANGEPKVSQPQVKSQKKAEPRSKKRAERSTSGQLGRSQHSNRSERVLDWWAQSDWSGWSWDSWDSGKTARWQKRDPGRPGPAPDEATQRDE
ncbi:unnamed protein product [Durusdinium trenchii]|uniref:Uncharacterized protein n=1 Tax=Durusdinium trenchii TaxID=1381693 RepID=A0ABP0SZJ2_9DINO